MEKTVNEEFRELIEKHEIQMSILVILVGILVSVFFLLTHPIMFMKLVKDTEGMSFNVTLNGEEKINS